jgi:hypothetical protein
LEQPIGGEADGQAEGEQRIGAVGLESRRLPRQEATEVGNHAADEHGREQAPAGEQSAERKHGGRVG